MSEANNTTITNCNIVAVKNGKGQIIAAIIALVLVIAAFVGLWIFFGPKTTEGSKAVTLSVVDADGSVTTYNVKTEALYLQNLMDELKAEGFTYGGTEGPYGLMIDTINGVRADYTLDGAYWSFYVNDEYAMYGISEQPVNDGDDFDIVYTPAE